LGHIVNARFVRHRMVLLGRRSPQQKSYPGLWSFPSGHAEPGETMLEALIRELHEEVGVTPTGTTYLASIRDPSPSPADAATYHMYAVTGWIGGEPRLVGDEHTQLEWFSLQAAARFEDLALPEYRPLFDEMRIRVAGAPSQ
jgi:8-oxo-dGTP diphosphatase